MPVHVGQQVIVDRAGRSVGCELLFRAFGGAAGADVQDGDLATAQVLVATFLEFGLERLVGDGLAFVNLPRAFLVGDLPLPFPPGQVVLEVLEDVPADPDVLEGIARLVRQGHRIALDDVTAERSREELLHLAHFVKIDLLATDPADLPDLVRRCSGQGRQVVAEKVESDEQMQLCRSLGVHLFQGHLLGRPRTLTRQGLEPSQLACVRLLALLADQEVRTEDVVAALQADPSLTMKVLQVANSAASGLARRPGSVREAVLHVGLQTLQAWATLLSLGAGAGSEPLVAALRRARMCQLLADPPASESSAFLVGLLSGLTDALGVPADDLLGQVPVAPQVSAALLHRQGPLGDVLTSALAYEAGPEQAPDSARGSASVEQARTAFLLAQAWTVRAARGVAVG